MMLSTDHTVAAYCSSPALCHSTLVGKQKTKSAAENQAIEN